MHTRSKEGQILTTIGNFALSTVSGSLESPQVVGAVGVDIAIASWLFLSRV